MMSLDSQNDDELILWDKVNPNFTTFHKNNKIFSEQWCKYSYEKLSVNN